MCVYGEMSDAEKHTTMYYRQRWQLYNFVIIHSSARASEISPSAWPFDPIRRHRVITCACCQSGGNGEQTRAGGVL